MITFNMLEEHLGYEVISEPVDMGMRFSRLFLAPSDNSAAKQLRATLNDRNAPTTLLLGTPEAVLPLLEKYPWVGGLCVRNTADQTDETTLGVRNMMTVITEDSLPLVYERTQAYFSSISSWVSTMKDALLDSGGFQKLLNCSAGIFKNFISILNSEFTLLAWTKDIPIDDPLSMDLIKRGKHSPATIEIFRQFHVLRDWEVQRGIVAKPGTPPITTYPTLDYVFNVRANYFVCVTMHCNVEPPSESLKDTYQLLIDHMERLVQAEWDKYLPTSQAASRLFYDLLNYAPMSQQHLAERLTELGAKTTGSFRLAVISFPMESSELSLLNFRIKHLRDFFPYCIIGNYEEHVLLLEPHSTDLENIRSNIRPIIATHNCSVGVSSVFYSVKDLPHAFNQAAHALELGRAPERSFGLQLSQQASEPVYVFQDYFSEYVVQSAMANDDLIAYTVKDGIVNRIAQDDAKHGTNDLEILYEYIRCERNAGDASKHLFMHRNTLLYRIHKLEDRYRVDLSDPQVREQIIFEYHICS